MYPDLEDVLAASRLWPRDPDWPAPAVFPELSSSYGMSIRAEPFDELVERLGLSARQFVTGVAVELLVPMWDDWIQDWWRQLKSWGTRFKVGYDWAAWPRTLLKQLSRWAECRAEGRVFEWEFRLTDHFNAFREDFIYGLHHGRFGSFFDYPRGYYASLQLGEAMWNMFGWVAQSIDHERKTVWPEPAPASPEPRRRDDDRYHELTSNRARNALVSIGSVMGCRAIRDEVLRRRVADPSYRANTLHEPDDLTAAEAEAARMTHQLLGFWWQRCRERLAFRDSVKADFLFEFDITPTPDHDGQWTDLRPAAAVGG